MTDHPLLSIMYVDDEPDIREIVEMSLGLSGEFNVTLCESGAKALQLLPSVSPDLVLLDVMMPGLDGPATLARMRAQESTRQVSVVFMTAKALPQEIERFMKLGAIGVISKPFDPMKLTQKVKEIWQSANR
jgi:two-component system, OmpR family, response regulator